ncbi:MAG TPA: site-specific integrase [Burkholderiales bacterium]|nr:site-specific integrase [Burkholderiales bacterium]
MAQTARDSKLETRTARLRLPLGQRHFKSIGKGLTLIYRRTGEGFGTWTAKLALPGGKYTLRTLGGADDYQEANGADVLNFGQAHDRVRALANEAKANDGVLIKPASVAEAAERYLAWYRENRRGVRETETAINAHILPALGDKQLSALTTAHIRSWLEQLAAKPARVRTARTAKTPKYRAAPKTADEKRARRSTANRLLNVLKAILNRAFRDGQVADDTAWRKVKPFPKADEPRIRFLSDAEAVRLVNACPADLRALVRAALLTGARFGELVELRAHDVNLRTAQVYVAQSKSGRPRHIPVNDEGVALFRQRATGKTGDERLFVRAKGQTWGKNHHVRALIEACRVAKIQPAIAFHELRHTYASHLAQAGVDLLTISKLLGHADTRITSKHYAHLADKTLAAAVTRLPSFVGKVSRRDNLQAVR